MALNALLLAGSLLLPQATQAGKVTSHGTFVGQGGVASTLVGRGPRDDTERQYVSLLYYGGRFDLLAIDPATGKADVFTPSAKESGAYGLVEAPDGHIYVGTSPRAHLMRLDWARKTLVDLGRPAPTEQWIWSLAVGADGKIYGGTYPNAKLIRFNPRTGTMEDLGRLSDREKYARFVAADREGFVYGGIGTVQRDLVAYEIATGKMKSILPEDERKRGVVQVFSTPEGQVLAKGDRWYRLEGWTATPTSSRTKAEVLRAQNRLRGGTVVEYVGSELSLSTGGKSTRKVSVEYPGRPLDVFRLALGPDGSLYGSTALPLMFFKADPDGTKIEKVAKAGEGELYSMASVAGKLVMASYGGIAPLLVYEPGKPWRPGRTESANPRLVTFKGAESSWRPRAMVVGRNGKVYVGSTAGYGALGGLLGELDVRTATFAGEIVVPNHSVVSLAVLPNGDLIGGTSTQGGGGSRAVERSAKLFRWDPLLRQVAEIATPVPDVPTIDALAVGRDGLVYGFAGAVMFVLDPNSFEVRSREPHNLGRIVYNAIGPGPNGELFGLASEGVFRIDQRTRTPRQLYRHPDGITAGFAIRRNRIYFASGAKILSYRLP